MGRLLVISVDHRVSGLEFDERQVVAPEVLDGFDERFGDNDHGRYIHQAEDVTVRRK